MALYHGNTYDFEVTRDSDGGDITWKLLSINMIATTTADVDNRKIIVKFLTDGNYLIQQITSKAIPASQTNAGAWLASGLPRMGYDIDGGYAAATTLGIDPESYKVKSGEKIQFTLSGTHNGDHFNGIMSLEEVQQR